MPPERAHVYWNGTFSDAKEEPGSVTRNCPARARVMLESCASISPATISLPYLWFDQKYFLPDDILNKVDRMSMAHAVEVRPPFLDHRIVEFAASLPPYSRFMVRGRKSFSRN